LWLAWRAMSLVPEAMQELEEQERDEWRSLAIGPVLRCPQCPWVSHNANITDCAECGTPLERVPARSLS
jgi:rRNA maturation endonuclease Nob1